MAPQPIIDWLFFHSRLTMAVFPSRRVPRVEVALFRIIEILAISPQGTLATSFLSLITWTWPNNTWTYPVNWLLFSMQLPRCKLRRRLATSQSRGSSPIQTWIRRTGSLIPSRSLVSASSHSSLQRPPLQMLSSLHIKSTVAVVRMQAKSSKRPVEAGWGIAMPTMLSEEDGFSRYNSTTIYRIIRCFD